eukprot:13408663-Ditylum_brightwellii.AAC.1
MDSKYGERWWQDLSVNQIPLHAWWMVRARGTTSEATALQWGTYMPMPLSDSGRVVMTKEWWGSWVPPVRGAIGWCVPLEEHICCHAKGCLLEKAFRVELECSLWVLHRGQECLSFTLKLVKEIVDGGVSEFVRAYG